VAVQLTRLCIISRDPLRGGHFLAALQASLGPEDDLEIIIDRRHGGSSGEPDLKEDRRRHGQVDLALEANGFAIVPASVDPIEDSPPIERLSPVDDEDEERVESTHDFQRQQPGTLIPKLLGVLSGLTLAALVLVLAGQVTGQSLLSQLFTGPPSGGPDQPPGRTNESSAPAQFPAVAEEPVVAETRPARTETPPPARPNSESHSVGGPASTTWVSPRDADRLTPKPRETSGPSEVTGTASLEPSITSRETSPPPKETSPPPRETSTSTRGASAPANETGAPPRAGTGQGASGGRSRLGATARQSPSAPPLSSQVAGGVPPGAATPKATPTQVAGSHRAELVGKPVSRGWGDSYAVRLLDPAGQPMVVAGVVLVARMADGTVENIAMGALPEPGTYRGTVPTGRSTPVDLRVRVTTGDESVEVPVKR
jgi:hypothetical protein